MAHEDRDNEERQLGELPIELLRERGENYPPGDSYMPGVPRDIANTVNLATAPARLGTRSQGASVTSAFDTRPINATDFRTGETQQVTLSLEIDKTLEFSYTVPQSYIAILRSFECRQNPLFIVDNAYLLTYTIFVDGIAQLGHDNLVLSQQPGVLPTHILAKEASIITLRITYPTLLAETITLNVWASFYGNLLLTKNVPLVFEVGNPLPVESIPLPPSIAEPTKQSTSVSVPVPGAPIRTQFTANDPNRNLIRRGGKTRPGGGFKRGK